jgi:hypothetical protein
MKIEVAQTFYGRPDESVEENTIFLEGAVVDVPDDFGKMVVAKALAKAVSANLPQRKDKPNETE